MAEDALRSPLRAGNRVVCLGDSITADPEGYVTMARDVLRLARPDEGIELVNAGAPGNTAADMLARFERDVLSREPDWVTISAGVNDAARGVSGAEYAQSVGAMIGLGLGAGIRVGLCTPTRFEDVGGTGSTRELNRTLASYSEWLERTASENDCLLIPMFETFRLVAEAANHAGEPWLTHDGCHMSPVGRYLMGLTFLAAFRVSLPGNPREVPVSP
jgi:lysophospholipase L1-like esterase